LLHDDRAALDAMTKGGFDLVLLDGRMTLLDGLDALRKIRALPEGLGTLPVYIVTGIVEPEKRSAFLEAGVNGVLSKPFETQQLVALVEKVRNARALREPIEAGENDFDADMLVELEHLVGRDELMQIVIAFAAETDASMAALRGHVEEGAIEKLATIAHDLKN
jgi:CheY-like chemotaxis protein